METSFVCNLNALDNVQKARYREIFDHLNQARQAVKELNDGYAFRFIIEPKLFQETAEFVVYERLCCPFFNFELAVEQDSNRFWLRLRGQEGIKEFIRAEFKIYE